MQDYVDPTGNNNVSEGFSGQSAGQSIGGGIRGPQQSQQPAQQTVTQPVKSFAGRGVAIGGVDPNDRAEEGGILDRVNQPKAYNKVLKFLIFSNVNNPFLAWRRRR